jgi:hypothetical protein
MSKMPFIIYSGIGSNESHIHSIEEFLDIMKHASSHYYEMTSLGFYMEYKTYLLPDDFTKFTLQEWIEYTGAEYRESN